MQKHDADDFDPGEPTSGPPATPRVSGEVEARLPESSTRSARPPASAAEPAPSAPQQPADAADTLLSAGKPADRLELLLEDRLAVVDQRLRELDARLETLEQKKSSAAPEPRHKPWLWLLFLFALVVAFQLLHRVR